MDTINILNASMFYILSAVIIAGTVASIFSRHTVHSVISAITVFWATSGLYFLLKAHFLGAVQILIWGVGVGILLMFAVMLTNTKEDDKTSLTLRPITFLAPVLCVLFAIIILPFVLNFLGVYNTAKEVNLALFCETIYRQAGAAFELAGILLFTALLGISTIFIFNKRKLK